VRIPPLGLRGTLHVPEGAMSLVIFAHGSGSSRLSPRNVEVATGLNHHGMATLLFDLLTGVQEENESGRAKVFNIKLLARRLVDAIRWIDEASPLKGASIGLFGASTGAAAALVAAAQLGTRIGAVVSRGGRPDLAGDVLANVRCPTLLIVGGADYGVIELNEAAFQLLAGPKDLKLIPGATHLFEERGALQEVVELAAGWFGRHLDASPPAAGR
jgi:pimeloyl-ACP methyl ester carboxylesterase